MTWGELSMLCFGAFIMHMIWSLCRMARLRDEDEQRWMAYMIRRRVEDAERKLEDEEREGNECSG